MKFHTTITKAVRLSAAVSALGLTCIANAISYSVSVDTSSLVGDPQGPFYLDFVLTDGSGSGNSTNSAEVTDIKFGGGNADGAATTIGGAAGDIGSSLTLVDSEFLNELYQAFTPGSFLSFVVTLTNSFESDIAPDMFNFSILDGNLSNIPTLAYDWSDTLLQVTIAGATPTTESFAGAGDYSSIGAPNVSTVPEGSTGSIVFISMLALFVARKRFGSRECVRSTAAA